MKFADQTSSLPSSKPGSSKKGGNYSTAETTGNNEGTKLKAKAENKM